MAIPLVQVRHKVTGQKTFLPETALRHLSDYVKTPSQKSREQVPDGTAFPTETADDTSEETTTTAAASAPTTPKGK